MKNNLDCSLHLMENYLDGQCMICFMNHSCCRIVSVNRDTD